MFCFRNSLVIKLNIPCVCRQSNIDDDGLGVDMKNGDIISNHGNSRSPRQQAAPRNNSVISPRKYNTYTMVMNSSNVTSKNCHGNTMKTDSNHGHNIRTDTVVTSGSVSKSTDHNSLKTGNLSEGINSEHCNGRDFSNTQNIQQPACDNRTSNSTISIRNSHIDGNADGDSHDVGKYNVADSNQLRDTSADKNGEKRSRSESESHSDSEGHLKVPQSTTTLAQETHTDISNDENNDGNRSPSSRHSTSSPSLLKAKPKQPLLSINSSPRTRHAPQIMYSSSQDRTTTVADGSSRPIVPSLPYSPYGSPSGSPARLRRQSTKETRKYSLSESEGYTLLNQYRLKDEIGKVRDIH